MTCFNVSNMLVILLPYRQYFKTQLLDRITQKINQTWNDK